MDRIRSALGRSFALWVLLCGAAAFARAEEPPRVRVVWTDVPPVIDGRLDDPVWEQAAVIDRFVQAEPDQGEPGSERTVVRILTDRDHLYFAVRCYDREPDRIVANRLLRDDFLFWDDRFNIALDTFHDHRNGYFFQVNALGARRDGIVEGPNFEGNWDGVWEARARIDEQGWTAEIAIPYKSVAFDPRSDTWGMNLTRGIRRRGEDQRWADPHPERLMINMANAGVLEGMTGISQGVGLDVVPGSTLRRVDQPDDPRIDQPERHYTAWDPTFDAFYRLLPSLTGSLTVNTDFGEAEVDEVQVNLTRFALFFPERRDFFLQDALIFDFGGLADNRRGVDQNGRAFFSRNIGLAPDGDPVDIRAGAKVTGRIGRFNVGLLSTQLEGYTDTTTVVDDGGTPDDPSDDRFEKVESKNLSVARLSMNVLDESRVGMIFTNGDPRSNRDNSLAGADFLFRDSDWRGSGKVLSANLWYQHSFTEGISDDEMAFGALLAYPNDTHNWQLGYKEIEEQFRPALGFVNRSGIRQYDGQYRFRTRPSGTPVQTVDQLAIGRLVTDRRNQIRSARIEVRPVDVVTKVVDVFRVGYRHRFERLIDEFDLLGAARIPIGRYHFDEGTLEVQTSYNRPLRAELQVEGGTFFTGRRLRVRAETQWRPSAHFLLALEYDHNEFWMDRVDEGTLAVPVLATDRLRSRVARARIGIFFTPDVSWVTFAQYDNVSDRIGINSRLRWIVSDRREIFLVVNQGLTALGADLRRGRTEPIAKIGWLLRF